MPRPARYGRATQPAKGSESAGRGFIPRHEILARKKTELAWFDLRIGAEGGAAELPAVGAMAVREDGNLVTLVPNPPAETATVNHADCPRCRTNPAETRGMHGRAA